MRVSLQAKVLILLLATLSVFWLPRIVTLTLMFLGGLLFPPAPLALGILADLLYYPGTGFLWSSFEGLVLMLVAVAVRHLVKTRIM